MKFACYDPDGVWGLGETREQARHEAEGFFRDSFADQNDPALLRSLAALDIAEVDDLLARDITIHGPGFPCFRRDGDRLVFWDEPDSIGEIEPSDLDVEGVI